MSNFIKYTFAFVILILAQVLVMNNIQFSGYINPYIYILFLMILPLSTPRYLLLLLGFLLGISVDVFSNTLGMHASATVFIAFIRPFIINNSSLNDDQQKNLSPTIESFGVSGFLKYVAIMVLAHHLFLFYIEAFTFNNFITTMGRVLMSSLFTYLIVIIIQYLFFRK